MEEKRLEIIDHIKKRLASLEELGKVYSEDKINNLALKLLSTNKSLEEIKQLIDNKFSNEVRKINHNNHLATLKEYYLSSIDKLKRGNNCYLLSYEEGVKILEQAHIKEDKEINKYLKQVIVNKIFVGYQKDNSVINDYELIMSDIAYLLKIRYAKTYRVFDSKMEPQGILNISFANKNERYLNFEETLHFIKEESPNFTLKTELEAYHDKNIKRGLKTAKSLDDYQNNLEYIFKLFQSLPDITKKNIEKLKKDYLNMKVFEILINSLNNNLSNSGIIIDKSSLKYTYELSPSYNKYITSIDFLKENETIFNFFIVDKKQLLSYLIDNYYDDIKELLNLITDNKDTLIPIINQVITEHLDFKEYNKYYNDIKNNISMIEELVAQKKQSIKETNDDKETYEDNNISYYNRIAPFIENYVEADDLEDDKGSTVLMAIVAGVLFITIIIILLAIIAVSRLDI